MSAMEDREFIINYMVQKEMDRARDIIGSIKNPQDGIDLIMGYISKVEKGRVSGVDVSDIQEQLIKIAATSMALSIDVCYDS